MDRANSPGTEGYTSSIQPLARASATQNCDRSLVESVVELAHNGASENWKASQGLKKTMPKKQEHRHFLLFLCLESRIARKRLFVTASDMRSVSEFEIRVILISFS
jgi:hypothetical protein